MKSFSYECFSCNQLVDQSFFLCCNCHVSCNYCQHVEQISSGVDECPACEINNVLCLNSALFRERRKVRCDSTPGVPTLILPTRQLVSNIGVEGGFPRNNVIQCPDCYKCVLLTHTMEHYACDHKSTTITPIFPGAVVSFRFSPHVMEEGILKRLQLLLMVDVTDGSDSSSDGLEASVGGEKLFFLAGTKIKIRGSSKNSLIALWLCASFHVSSTVFSVEVTSHFNTTISTTVTGVPIDLTVSDLFKRKNQPGLNNDTVVAVKESSIKTLEQHGGCIINVSITHSMDH